MSMNKLLVVVVSDDLAKAQVALQMATRMRRRGTLEDVQVLFFGPSEKTLAAPPQALAELLQGLGSGDAAPMACRAVADQLGVAEMLESSGSRLVAAGQEIERRILDGYQVMTF